MKIKTFIGVPITFIVTALYWAGLPLGFWDKLFPLIAYLNAILFGVIAGFFFYGVVLNKRAVKEFQEQLKENRSQNTEGDSNRSMALGYVKFISVMVAINIIFTALRHGEL